MRQFHTSRRPAPVWALLSLGLAPLAHGAQTAEEAAYVDPYASLTMPTGAPDGAVPIPTGGVFHEPIESSQRETPPIRLAEIDEAAFNESLQFTEHRGATWMRGPDYKACVSTNGFTYIPFLGSNAPRSYPVHFQLQSATVGGRALPLNPEAEVTRAGARFVLDRGPVDVIYDVADRQVEQLFALDIEGAEGDLVVEVRVTSDLVGGERAEGFRFNGPSGGMDYGAATVLDGTGRSLAIETVLDKDVLRLTVPATFLAEASGEVVIDPILSTYLVDGTSGDQRYVDVAYDQSTDTFTFVYEDTFSGNDADIYRRTRTRDGALVSGSLVFGDDRTWREPVIANLNGENQNLIVARSNNSGGNAEIWGRVHRVDVNSLGPDILIGDDGGQGWDNVRPDVAGNARNQPGLRFMVVWERRISATRHSVRIRSVEADGSLGTLYSMQDLFDTHQEEVSISQSAGDPSTVNVWNIVWRSEDLGSDTDSLYGAQLTTNVFLDSPVTALYTVAPGRRLREIDVSDGLDQGGGSSTYVATFDDYGSSLDDATLVVIQDGAFVTRHNLSDLEHARPDARRNVHLAATEDRFIVTCEDQSNGDIHATVLQLIGQSQFGVVERRVLLGSTLNANRGGGAISSVASGGAQGSEAGVGWSFVESGFDYGAAGATLISSTAPIPGYHFCVSRPNSTGSYGFLTMSGTPTIADTKIVTAASLPPNQFAILLVGTVPVNIPMIGGSQGTLCLGGQFGRYNSQISSSGSSGVASFLMNPSAIPAPFGADVAMSGEAFYWQAWHRDVAGGNATSNLTNAFAVTFE